MELNFSTLGSFMLIPSSKLSKIIKGPVTSNILVPIVIILLGIFCIFIFNKIISNERDYKDLVGELQSRAFGNKWIAAYELSKQINAKQIPINDYPWLIANLSDIYNDSSDSRTRSFIVAALGALKNEATLPILAEALKDEDTDVLFHTIVALGSMPKGIIFPWKNLIVLLNDRRPVIRQSSTLALATHAVPEAQLPIQKLLNDSDKHVKYAAATTLIAYRDQSALPVLKEALLLSYSAEAQQVADLKLSILEAIKLYKWTAMHDILMLVQNDLNQTVSMKAKEVISIIVRL